MKTDFWLATEMELFGRANAGYFPSPGLLMSANVALTLGRPLLLTGEPGCGKTDFAFAVAREMAKRFSAPPEPLECYVRSDTRARDLLYSYDALRRFGDAHHGGKEGVALAAEVRHYIDLEPLGQALASSVKRVVLIDEIDKAPRDLPNDLLRELDQGSFTIPEIPEKNQLGSVAGGDHELCRTMGRKATPQSKPFVVITSNVERHLPDAFLRRCVFWHIAPHTAMDLKRILHARFPKGDPSLLKAATEVFQNLRAFNQFAKPPATAELIDWISALSTIGQHEGHAPDLRRHMSLAGKRHADWLSLPAIGCLLKSQEDLLVLSG